VGARVAGAPVILVLVGDRCTNVDALHARQPFTRLVPTPARPAISPQKNKSVFVKYTSGIVAPLDQGGDRGLNKCSSSLRNTGDADKPVLSGRRPMSALGEAPSTKGREKSRADNEKGGGSQCKKKPARPFSVKKQH